MSSAFAGLLGRQHAQHQHFERDHVHFEPGDLVAKAPVVPQGLALRDAFESFQLALGPATSAMLVRSWLSRCVWRKSSPCFPRRSGSWPAPGRCRRRLR